MVVVEAGPNDGQDPRVGSLTIAGESFAVAQSGVAVAPPTPPPTPPPPAPQPPWPAARPPVRIPVAGDSRRRGGWRSGFGIRTGDPFSVCLDRVHRRGVAHAVNECRSRHADGGFPGRGQYRRGAHRPTHARLARSSR